LKFRGGSLHKEKLEELGPEVGAQKTLFSDRGESDCVKNLGKDVSLLKT
jgi:hypothetical protein